MKHLLFTFVIFLLSCTPAKLETSDTISDIVVEEESGMHGGSPVPDIWSDCGGAIGDHPCNFSFLDQNGDTFELYQNYGKVMVLDFSAMWCGVCNNIANDAQVFMNDYADKDFMWVTILIDNSNGDPPTQEDLSNWTDLYGISTSPVLAGNRSIIDTTGESGIPVTSWPTIVILDKDMIISNGLNGWNEQTIRGWIEEKL